MSLRCSEIILISKHIAVFLAWVSAIRITLQKQNSPAIRLGELNITSIEGHKSLDSSLITRFSNYSFTTGTPTHEGSQLTEPRSLLSRLRKLGRRQDTVHYSSFREGKDSNDKKNQSVSLTPATATDQTRPRNNTIPAPSSSPQAPRSEEIQPAGQSSPAQSSSPPPLRSQRMLLHWSQRPESRSQPTLAEDSQEDEISQNLILTFNNSKSRNPERSHDRSTLHISRESIDRWSLCSQAGLRNRVASESEQQRRTHFDHGLAGDDSTTPLSHQQPCVTYVRTLDTRSRSDSSPPKLRDLVVLPGSETVLVTDWANRCVKALHVRREKDASLVLGGKPWAITVVPENLAAVSLPWSQQICVIKINPTLSVQNSFVSAKRYTGLASLSSDMLVASGGSNPPCVDIIDLYGEVLKSFSIDRRNQPLFEYPAYVTVTPAAMILVTDRRQGAVTCLTPTGDVKFRFQPEGSRRLKQPSGVVADCRGRTLVAESRGLLALTAGGQFHSALTGPQDKLLEDPRGVAVCGDGTDKLVYVTSSAYKVIVLSVS